MDWAGPSSGFQTVTSFFRKNQPVSPRPSGALQDFYVVWIRRTAHSKITKNILISRNKNPQLRSPSTLAWLAICTFSLKLITQSAPSPMLSTDRNEASPSERFKKTPLEKKNCLVRSVLPDNHKTHHACGFHRRHSAT